MIVFTATVLLLYITLPETAGRHQGTINVNNGIPTHILSVTTSGLHTLKSLPWIYKSFQHIERKNMIYYVTYQR